MGLEPTIRLLEWAKRAHVLGRVVALIVIEYMLLCTLALIHVTVIFTST
jgi:hypothetical protein